MLCQVWDVSQSHPMLLYVHATATVAPDVPEPFLTLEMIYEEMEDEEKRFQVGETCRD